MDIKAAAARAERLLERYAEPLATLHDAAWPDRLLELAWRRLIDNSAHDSICGCSHDAVVDQVLTRFAEAEQIARGVIRMALRGAAASAPRGGWAIVNPSPRERADLVELEVDSHAGWQAIELELADGRRVPTQTIERPESVLRRMRLTGSQLTELFERRLHGRELFGHSLDGHRIDRDGPTPRLDLLMDDPSTPDDFDVDELIDAVRAATASDLDQIWDVVVLRGDRQRIVAAIPVPALGWSVARAVEAGELGRWGRRRPGRCRQAGRRRRMVAGQPPRAPGGGRRWDIQPGGRRRPTDRRRPDRGRRRFRGQLQLRTADERHPRGRSDLGGGPGTRERAAARAPRDRALLSVASRRPF
ncbi:MAG: hypothetical protein WKF78_13435 [Candidatus Limnocylindrales bacterium]